MLSISPTDMTLLFNLAKQNKKSFFSCFQNHMPYLGQREGCVFPWGQTSLWLGKVKAFPAFPPLFCILASIYGLESWHLIVFFLSHLDYHKYFNMNKAMKSSILRTTLQAGTALHPGKILPWLWKALPLPL